MLIKRILIWTPLILVAILAQSFFWVPTYNDQATGNPKRLLRYIEATTGDARILNPILSADTASSAISERVFDGLLDLDDQLRLRPRLAESWVQYEEAYLRWNPQWDHPKAGTPQQLADLITAQLQSNTAWRENLKNVEVISANSTEGEIKVPELNAEGKPVLEKGRPKMKPVAYTLSQPPVIKFTLNAIDQDFFKPIEALLGQDYFEHYPYPDFIKAKQLPDQAQLESHYTKLLQVTEHNPVIIFDLKQNVRFHDGHVFDSGDVLFTYQSIMDTRNLSPRRSDYEPVKTAEPLGRHRIKFTYKRLFSPAINAWSMGILPEHLLNKEALEKEARAEGLSEEKVSAFTLQDTVFNRKPVGTGPFRFVEWQSDELIRLDRNPDYWEEPAEFEEFVMRVIPDALTRELEFYAGAVDNYDVEPYQVKRLADDPRYQSFSTVGFNYSYIGYNLRKPLFKDAEVRRALGMALDVEQIIKYVIYEQGERVTGPYPKITDWYDPLVKPLPYDPEGALAILNRLGWKKNASGWLEKDGKEFEFNLITNNGNSSRKAILTVVQNQWRKIGIKCNTQLFEWAVFLKDFVNSMKFDALILGWSMGTDPDLYQLWHSSQTGPRQLNFVGFESAEADELIVRIRREYDRDRQEEMTHQLHALIAKEQPYTFLYVGKAARLLDKKLVIVNRQPDGEEDYQEIYPVKGGNIRYHFNRWRKLAIVPEFAASG